MKILVIDWTADAPSTLAVRCEQAGHEVLTETRDGAEAYRKAGEFKPDLVLLNYAVKPSHGRLTAESIRKRKSTAAIPIYFVDGPAEENRKVAHLGTCIGTNELTPLLT